MKDSTYDIINRLKNLFKGDKVIWSIFLALCIVSIVEVYSSSSVLGYKSGNYWYAALYHTILLGVGVVCMIFILNIPCRYFKAVQPFCMAISVLLLIGAYLLGEKINDAARWIKILGIPIQPSEIAKGTMVITTARILSIFQTKDGTDSKAFKGILYAAVWLILPIFPENFSTAFLISVVIFLMMIIGRVPLRQLGKLVSVVSGIIVLFLMLVMIVGKSPSQTGEHNYSENVGTQYTDKKDKSIFHSVFHRFDLWHQRIDDWLDEEYVAPCNYDLSKNTQVGHAKIAIATSNFIGVGPGNSEQRDFLPLAFSDFIYAIIFEEMGWLGAAFVASLYIMLMFRTGMIARRCLNAFPAFLAMGLALLIVVQAFFNMGVAVGIFPVTGQPLPIISKGGTSSIINCIYIGMILSVSRTAKKRDSIPIIDK